MNRRPLLLGAVGAIAAGAGVAWQLARDSNTRVDDSFWHRRFERPEGGEIALADLRGRPWVLNFWATWCPPCLKEMPELDRFHRDHLAAGWQVLGLAVDRPQQVRDFLVRRPVAFPIGLAGLEGTDLTRELGNDSGALPFTAVFDARGRLVRRKLGQTSYAELAGWARAL